MNEPLRLYFCGKRSIPPPGWLAVPPAAYHHGGRHRNAFPDYEQFNHALYDPPSTVIEDFYTIISTAFMTDLWIVRNDDSAPDGWSRSLAIDIPVDLPELWSRPDITNMLTRLLDFTTSDTWTLQFHKGATHPWQRTLSKTRAHCVALFSGGLDSYSYAATHLGDRGEDAIVVSHLMPPSIGDLQNELLRDLRHPPKAARFRLQVNRFDPDQENESTQRTRGLLFMAAGLLLCSSNHVETLLVPENGYLAINPPLTPSRPGACMTKSVHPLTMHLVNTLLASIDSDHRVENPYATRTKGEICRAAVEDGRVSLSQLARTITCSRAESRDSGPFANCGYCYACLVRHASLQAAGGDPTTYRNAHPSDPDTISETLRADWLALTDWLSRDFTTKDLIAGSSLPPGADLAELSDVVSRSRLELSAVFT